MHFCFRAVEEPVCWKNNCQTADLRATRRSAVLPCTVLPPVLLQYRQLDGSTFTFTRNALIQRLVAISSKFSEGDIHELLEQHGLQDRGPSVLEGLHSGLQVARGFARAG
jgi:hypothetical protein